MKRAEYIPNNEEVFFEEAVFDSFSSNKKLDSLELPLSRKAFILILVLIILAVIFVFFRIAYLGVQKGDFYSLRAEANIGKESFIPANRGIIYDRFGKPLVENIASFTVVIKIREFLQGSEKNKEILAEILEIPLPELEEQITSQDLEKSTSVILERNVDSEKIIQLKALQLAGVEIIDDYRRRYIDGPIFSTVLGYTGQGKSGTEEGKTGIEAYYNDYLRGIDGVSVSYKDARGNILDKKQIELPKNGQDLTLTIDLDFQKFFYEALKNKLISLGRNSGVGIAINPQNGEVLSLINLPSYDNNIFSKSGNNKEKIAILNSPDKPMFNKAISGNYAPASTIKPMEAIAALAEGVVIPSKEVFSPGYIEIPNPYDPEHPSRFMDWKAHGWVNLYSAIANSCDVYFYSIGGGYGDIKGLGIGKLKEYWQKFGLGQKTGIDLNSEAIGFLPDPQLKEAKKNDIWRIGDTYNVSIGQGDLLVTPIQLINQIAAIGNEGKFYRPHLNKDFVQEVYIDLGSLGQYINEAKKGMADTVRKSYGTANLLNILPVDIGAKTGSSQVANNTKINAFFVGFMPLENPEIAILVLIENAKEGSLNAVPVAKDVLEWYYWNRIAKSL